MSWRRVSVAALVPVMALVGASCQTGVQMWTGCAIAADGNRTGTDGTYVLECRDGEWVPVMTADEFVRASRGEEVTIAPVPTRPTDPTAPTASPTTTTTTTTTVVVDPWVGLEGRCFRHFLVNYDDLLFLGPVNTRDNTMDYLSGSDCTIPDDAQTRTVVRAPDVATAVQMCTTLGFTSARLAADVYPTFPDDGWFCNA
jgi:hypothetical protein